MKKLYYKILSFFAFCDHVNVLERTEMKIYKNQLISAHFFKCKFCGKETRQYDIQSVKLT